MNTSTTIDKRLASLDTTLFAIQPAHYSDRVSFLRIQNLLRKTKSGYSHLEVGSDLGASLLPFLQDPLCAFVASIDPRPNSQWDERGTQFHYPGNSTERMIEGLRSHCTSEQMIKLHTYDIDAKDARLADMPCRFSSVLIDAEHTNVAAFSDFMSVLPLLEKDAFVIFHDSNLVTDAILNVERYLEYENIPNNLFFLDDCVAVFGVNEYAQRLEAMSEFQLDAKEFIEKSRAHRWRNIRENN